MTPFKRNRAAWICIFGICSSTGLAALYLSNWFLAPFATVIYTGHFFLNRITCPNCGVPVTFVDNRPLAGLRVHKALFVKKCQNCGWDLDKEC